MPLSFLTTLIDLNRVNLKIIKTIILIKCNPAIPASLNHHHQHQSVLLHQGTLFYRSLLKLMQMPLLALITLIDLNSVHLKIILPLAPDMTIVNIIILIKCNPAIPISSYHHQHPTLL